MNIIDAIKIILHAIRRGLFRIAISPFAAMARFGDWATDLDAPGWRMYFAIFAGAAMFGLGVFIIGTVAAVLAH